MEIGDIVQIKSGGPNMTVDGFLSEENGRQYESGVGAALMKKSMVESNT